jgi:hypothetical protein
MVEGHFPDAISSIDLPENISRFSRFMIQYMYKYVLKPNFGFDLL